MGEAKARGPFGGSLQEWYGQAAPDGGPLRLRRLEQAGRLELVQVTNDPG